MRKLSITFLLIMKYSWVIVIAIIGLSACDNSGASELLDTSWELDTLNGLTLLPGTKITLEFSGDQVSGSAGCNQFGGIFQTQENTLSIDDVFSTEMGCMDPEGILEQEQLYLAALRNAAKYQASAATLVITDLTDKQSLVFAPLTGE